jgi:peptidyl-prolyl cis-trans isomerase B (cyclophilin B)
MWKRLRRNSVTGGRAAFLAVGASALLWAATGVAAAADKAGGGMAPPKGEPRAIIKTKYGEMEVRFFTDLAPKTVENFVKLAKSGFYNGTIFHRVIPNFMIQGGDPYTKDLDKKELYGTGGPDEKVKAEFNDTPHKRGIVSMARAQDKDSAGSQFFIVVEDSRFLDYKYTAFGEVVRGMGVADKIVSQPRDAKDNPLTRIEMTVTIVE